MYAHGSLRRCQRSLLLLSPFLVQRVVSKRFLFKMSSVAELEAAVKAYRLVPPESIRGMQVLDRNACKVETPLVALRIPSRLCPIYTTNLSPWLLHFPRRRTIVPDPTQPDVKSIRLILLSPAITSPDVLPESIHKFAKENEGTFTTFKMVTDYSYWSVEELLNAILPLQQDGREMATRSFETIGHIAHMNIRDKFIPYKRLIGDIILDKNSNIKTVVNKTDSIDTTFRFFKMEVLAGEDNFLTRVKENECFFAFSYDKVYWNSRLGTEHLRLLDTFSRNDVICDLMAGVGPFVVPACKRGLFVYGNDLNPDSYAAMCENFTINKLPRDRYRTYNLDAREAAKQVLKDSIIEGTPLFTQVVMNLPASAVEFLDLFAGLYHGMPEDVTLPTINVYCFSKAADPIKDARIQVEQNLKCSIPDEDIRIFDVRDVAPHKRMLCVSFALPRSVAFAAPSDNESSGVAAKRQKLDTDE